MSRKSKIKHMTEEELQSNLYAFYQKSGYLDHLKAQIRGQIVSDLYKISDHVDSGKFPNASDVEKCLLPLQICNWLVYDHLTRQDYQHSLSIFVPEAQLPCPEKFLTAGDILGLLKWKSTADFENISKLYSKNNELGHLHSLLLSIIKTLFNIPNKDMSLNGSHYENNEISNSKKISRGQEHNIAQNKSEAADDMSFSNEFAKFSHITLNRSFLNNDEVKSMELSFHEQLQSVKEENEKTVQKLRHRLFQELENLHSRERKMQIEIEHTKSDLQKEQNKLLKEKEAFKEKEILLEKEMTNKYEMKMRDVERDFASKLYPKDKEIESLKMKLMEKDEKLTHVETALVGQQASGSLLKQELNNLKHKNKAVNDKYASILDENINLLKKFENMSDYAILKEELAIKSREVSRLQNEIKDIHQKSETERKTFVETVRNLEDDLNIKESQLIQAKKELEHIRSALSNEQGSWKKERKKLEYELSELQERHSNVIKRVKEQEDNIEELEKTVYILKYKLSNHVVARSESFSSYKKYRIRSENTDRSKSETLFTKRNMFLQQEPEKYDDSKFKFIVDARSSYNKLKQDNDAVQEKCAVILSTAPEYNKQPFFDNHKFVSISKSNVLNYDVFSKPLNSLYIHDKKMSATYIKNPYSPNEQMVAPSLVSSKISNQTGIGNLGMSSQVPNFMNDHTEIPYRHYIHDKQYGFTNPNNDTSLLNTLKHGNMPDKNNGIMHDDSQKEDISTIQETELSEEEKKGDKSLDIINMDKLQQENENVSVLNKSGFNTSKASSDVNKNACNNHEINSELQIVSSSPGDVVASQAQSSPDAHVVKSNTTKTEPVVVNLDDAWRKRSSITSTSLNISEITDETTLKHKADNSVFPSLLTPIRTSSPVQDVSESDVRQPKNNKNAEPGLELLQSSIDENIMKDIIVNTPYALHCKRKEVEDSSIDAFNKVGQSSLVDSFDLELGKSKLTEELYTSKSAEKIGSGDSASELSEIHLSCGSEAEQQKEDSDAW